MWLRRAVALFVRFTIERFRAGLATSFVHHQLRNVAFAVCGVTAMMLAPTPAAALTLTTASVTASATTSAVGATVTLTAHILAIGGGTPTGNVQFFVNGVAAGAAVALDVSGQASLPTSALAVGLNIITINYLGDGTFAPSVSLGIGVNVTLASCTISLAASLNLLVLGTPVDLTASVSGGGPVPTGSVTLHLGALVLGNINLSGGTGTVSVSSLLVGLLSIVATYNGDTNYAPCTAPTIIVQVNKGSTTAAVTSSANPVTIGSPVTFTAAITGSGGTTPTGSVTFKDGATVLGSGSLDGSGNATLTTVAGAVGIHQITATYIGDSNFTGSTSPILTQVVNNPGNTASATALVASPNPASSGTPVTLTATVTGAGATPTGTVTFRDGATAIGNATVDGGGHAVLVTSSLSNGSHSISAAYGGDPTYAASTSSTTALVIGAGGSATSTTIASSANPTLAGQAVTFSAAVSASGATVTGSVVFKDGSSVLGAAVVTGNSASLTITTLSVGQHAITATYGGNGSFGGSTSAPLAQSISMPRDSTRLRNVQIEVTRVVAQNSGQAISGAIDAAIDEGFSDANQMLAPGELGLRLSSAGYDHQTNPSSINSPDVLVWSDLRHSAWSTSGNDLSGGQANALAGITYKLTPDFLVGGFGGYETFNYDVTSLDGHLKGGGWTAGGYVGWRILSGLRFDAGVAQSGIDYDGSAGTASGSFTGSRTLLTTALTGIYRMSPVFELEPSARIYALWEQENAYTDSLGVQQSDRNFMTARASVGSKLTYRWIWSDTIAIAPYAGLYADDYFTRDDAVTGALANAGIQGPSARLTGGVALTSIDGLKLSSAAELGGLGGGFTTWSLRARGGVAF
jgi:Bacterial Ig-like domain (group 3)/Autotransporter beta-domain